MKRCFGKAAGKMMGAALLCALCLAALMGCGGSASDAEAAANNRAYLSQANTAMMQVNADLASFAEAAAAGDVVTMEQTSNAAMRDMQAFEGLTPPESMAAIHDEYAAGCESLRGALQAYVQLYRDSPNLDEGAFNERATAIQQQYDEGLARIQQGDKMVVDLAGVPMDDDSSAESEGASDASDASEDASASEASSSSSAEAEQQG